MANSFQNQAPASHEVASEDTTVLLLDGFISQPKPTSKHSLPLFVSLDAQREAGTPLYSLDGNQGRLYLPNQFVGSLHKVEIGERTYNGDYQAHQKLCLSLTIGRKVFTLFVGLNSWTSNTLLASLGQLTEQQLHSPLLFKAIAGQRTVFFRVSVDTGDGEWTSVSISDEAIGNRMNADDLTVIANSVDELLSSTN